MLRGSGAASATPGSIAAKAGFGVRVCPERERHAYWSRVMSGKKQSRARQSRPYSSQRSVDDER